MSTQENQDFQQGPGAGFPPENLQGSGQGDDNGYSQMSGSQNDQGMGGGYGAHGSGVAGGYEGNQGGQSQQQSSTQGGEKQDWLDKGISMASKKAGYNISSTNADKAGDFVNKESKQYAGRNLPGVQ